MAEDIKEIDAGNIRSLEQFRETVLLPCKPVVFRGLVKDWPAAHAGLEGPEAFGKYLAKCDNGSSVGVFVGPLEAKGRFYYGDRLSGFNFDRTMMRFSDAVALIAANSQEHPTKSVYAGSIPIADCLRGFEDENRYPDFCPAGKARLWLGNAADVATHYDAMDNVACVIAGRRRFTLFAPEHIADLYIGPIDNTMAGRPVSLAATEPDPDRFPRFEAIRDEALVVELNVGDAIYIPKLWWHRVESLTPFNGLVNFWWDAFAPGPDEPYTALLLSMITIAERPAPEREAWRAYFDHYVFRNDGHPLAHLPEEARGILGDDRENYGRVRAAVMNLLRSAR